MADIVTAQGLRISTGRAGPFCHCRLPAARKSLFLTCEEKYPPIKKTPIKFILAIAPSHLFFVRLLILDSSQRWLLWSRTRQEEVAVDIMAPPQVAITGSGSEVMKVTWSLLTVGRGGREQPLVVGYTSVEES